MRISVVVLLNRLKKWNPEYFPIQASEKPLLIGVQLMTPEMKPLADHALVGDANIFNQMTDLSKQTLICIGSPDETVTTKNNCLCLSSVTSPAEVYVEVQKLFMSLEQWNEALFSGIINNLSLEELCLLSVPIFENPIFIHDTNSIVLANVNEMPGQFSWHYDASSNRLSLPLDIMNDFKISSEYQQTMNTVGAQMFSEQQFGYRILYINLWLEDAYIGRICVSELGRKIVPGDYELLEYFSKMVLANLRKSDTLQSNISNDLKQSLIELLEFKKTNEVVLINRLQAFQWKIDDHYRCVTIYLQERDYSTYANEFNCHKLEKLFPDFCIFLYQDRIIIVANFGKSTSKETDFFRELAVFLREGLLKASISSVGHDFRLFYYHYLQTDIAYRIGSRRDPMSWIYKFNDYKLHYILEQATNELMPLMLCESHLLNLRAYDLTHKSGLFDTLRTYLENERNLAETTRMLFVHRSTLLYRIKKIKSLLNLNLNDPQIRLHLLLSYELLDNIPMEGLIESSNN
ncbi:PucR family transcriptional regulator [Acetobacterium wieringae]|uniref:Purine catabolism regulatory protein n=1 Tax=Acetobacterium wieringae TaxID=52694 RepID=A0A1F2PNL6_9FIRM|nr:helix-turn-helix domain-containing protein [Acetobacterium wieringae]OFV72404.1 purine catabolism regulatory protein [Acetobacterium wieringae]